VVINKSNDVSVTIHVTNYFRVHPKPFLFHVLAAKCLLMLMFWHLQLKIFKWLKINHSQKSFVFYWLFVASWSTLL